MTEATRTTVRVPPAIRRRSGRNTVVTPVRQGREDTVPTSADPAVVKAPARVFRRRKLLEEGCYASIGEVAAAEPLERGCLGTLLRPALLAPDLVETILYGRHSDGVAPPRLLEPLPTEWNNQRAALGRHRARPAGEARGPQQPHRRRTRRQPAVVATWRAA